MALLPPFYLDAVIALGVGDDSTTRRWIGTGFLYGTPVPEAQTEKKSYRVFLITNKHVLGNQKELWVKFNSLTGSESQDFKIPLRTKNGRQSWIGHVDQSVDLGAIFINARFLRSKNMRFSYFKSDEHVYTIDQLRDVGVSEGDGVFVLGYPMGLVDSRWQAAVCRTGCIARVQDVIAAATGDILIDASIFPGNSGGPVIIKPESISIEGTNCINNANLIGVVQSYLPFQDVAISIQTGRPRITFTENSGLSPVIPIDRVNEVVSLTLKRTRKKLSQATWRAKNKQNSVSSSISV